SRDDGLNLLPVLPAGVQSLYPLMEEFDPNTVFLPLPEQQQNLEEGTASRSSSVTSANVCPHVNLDTECGTILTINDGSPVTITRTGQGPYDGNDDTLIGVVNNSRSPIRTLGLSSASDICGFDGDGIDAFGIPGNSHDSTGYGGPNAFFTNIN